MTQPIPIFKLNNGVKVPALGFGTFEKEDTVTADVMTAAVITALEAGYRHLDAAWIYENEAEVGAGIREFLSNNPSVKRDDIFVTTKVWIHLFEPEDVEWSLNDSLSKLGLDYIDCLLLHWPLAVEKNADNTEKEDADGNSIPKLELTDKLHLEPTWRAMEKLYKAGKVKSIGVSNWSIGRLETMLKYEEVKPAINQIEIHPFFPNTELVEYCLSHDILPVAYSPLGSQLDAGVDMARETLMNSAELKALAEKKGVPLAQLLISWGIKRGYAVIRNKVLETAQDSSLLISIGILPYLFVAQPKSANPSRIKSNFNLVELSDEDFAAINKVSQGRDRRFVDPEGFGYDIWAEVKSQ